ncbi:hypothetical protein [Hungatella hathewayi]|uniref:hypothetical protein n=1 Tax=Hungatella hathewayi TaxID=154046 RepID=UPI003562134B
MILREIFLETNENGVLLINDRILSQMGIGKNEQIYIAYLCPSDTEIVNEFREFILTKDGADKIQREIEMEEEVSLTIPNELMLDAGIPLEADLDVICKKRLIVIQPAKADEILPQEVLEACKEVGIEPEQFRIMLQDEIT